VTKPFLAGKWAAAIEMGGANATAIMSIFAGI
jgi:hypothetical protein